MISFPGNEICYNCLMSAQDGSNRMSYLRPCLNSSHLKGLAAISMVTDHAAYMMVDESRYAFAFHAMRGFGRLAFPIFAFFLVEGFFHTRDMKKYALRLFGLAAVSEIPFDLMFAGKAFYPSYQNTIWTLLLGLLTMSVLQWIDTRFEVRENKQYQPLLKAAAVAAFAICAWLLKTDYSWFGILLIALLYLFRNDRKQQCLYGGLWSLCYGWAILAFIPLYYYNGQRGRFPKYFFYIFYPAHILILYGISRLI